MKPYGIKSAFRTVTGGLSLVLGVSFLAWGVGNGAPGTTMDVKAGTPLPVNLTAPTPASVAPAYESYKYMGDRYRDPFIPLTGNSFDIGDHAPQISTLVLKGIVEDAKGRVAIVSSGAASFILRAGRLYDGRNHIVKGISGVIKAESVVLVGSDRTVKELVIDKSAL
jgi:hypothetical protein